MNLVHDVCAHFTKKLISVVVYSVTHTVFFASKMVFLFACKILLMTGILNATKIHNIAEIKALKANKEIFLTYNFVQWTPVNSLS